MNKNDLKRTPAFPSGMTRDEKRRDAYQIYLKDYLRCVAGVDENVGRLLDYLDRNNLSENTIVIYTGDQGFFLGEHGWFDKRMMFEQALRMPFLIRYPKEIQPGTVNRDIILNIDFAPLFMDYAGLSTPSWMQGESFRNNLKGQTPGGWRQAMYYRYWQQADGAHNMTAHYGIRTDRYKLIFWYGDALGKTGTNAWTPTEKISHPIWELYDLKNDPNEMNNIYNDPKNRELVKTLKAELLKLKEKYGDSDNLYPQMQQIVDQYWD